jgi:hypothetical protein
MPVPCGDATPVKLADVFIHSCCKTIPQVKKIRNIACDIKISFYICIVSDRIAGDENKSS